MLLQKRLAPPGGQTSHGKGILIESTSWAPNGYLLEELGGTQEYQGYPLGQLGQKIFKIYQICYLSLKFLKSPKIQEG